MFEAVGMWALFVGGRTYLGFTGVSPRGAHPERIVSNGEDTMNARQLLEKGPMDSSQPEKEAAHGPDPDGAAPPTDAVEVGERERKPPRRRRRGNLGTVLSYVALSVAAAWMVMAIVVGVLIVQTPDVSRAKGTWPEALAPTSFPMTYGGDAYTGIQNAASATENSVVASANMLAEATAEATKSQTLDLQKLALSVSRPLQVGAATLVVGSGVGPFVIVLAVVARPGTRRRHSVSSEGVPVAAQGQTTPEGEEK